MANAQANVTVNINADTGDLDAKLAKQEAAIKTLDGAINILGGSVELAASAMIATGLASEETAKDFEATALAAIAFADGSKRVLDGVKSLNEGLKGLGGISNVAANATKALNTAVMANPYVAVAVGVAALTAAIAIYIRSTDEEAKAIEARNKKQERELELLKEASRSRLTNDEVYQGLIATAKVYNRTLDEQIQFQRDYLEQGLADAQADYNAELAAGNKTLIEHKKLVLDSAKEALKGLEEISVKVDAENKKAAEAQAKRNEELRNTRLEAEGLKQTLQNLQDETIEWLGLFKFDQGGPIEVLEEIDEGFADLADTIFFTKEQMDEFNKAEEVLIDQSFEARKERLTAYYDNLIKQAASNAHEVEQLEKAKNKALGNLDKERKKDIEDAAKATLSTTIDLLATIRETTDDGSKEGFEKSKKFRIAETRLSSIQAAFDAYKSLAGVPYVGQALGVAAAAAALAAGQKAINDIKSSSYEDQNAPNDPTSGVGGINIPEGAGFGGAPNLGFGFGGRNFGQGVPVEAYVVAGTVTNAQQANAQIRRRRRLGG